MYSDNENELTVEERMLLASVPREMSPSDLLEERVVRALRRAGHFGAARNRSASGLSSMWKVAAAVALFAGGVATGRYVNLPDASRAASVVSPHAVGTPVKVGDRKTIPAKGREIIIAEREMWL